MRMILWALPLLAACMPVPQAAPDRDACGAAALQGLLGQSPAALEGLALAGPLRIINPGDAVTRDYIATRLNAQLDEEGRIVALTCG